MRKVCVPVMSRANFGRLKSVLYEISNRNDLELQLITGGSAVLPRFGAYEAIKAEGYDIKAEVFCTVHGDRNENMATTMGLLATQLVEHFKHLRPDVVLVHADRYEMLSVAAAASYMSIPLAHTQGGEVSGNIDDKVRNCITMLSDLHFPATADSEQRLLSFGIPQQKIHKVGCPTIDILKHMDFGKAPDEPYFLVVLHPVTTDNFNFQHTLELLYVLEDIGLKTYWLHSNIDAMHTEINDQVQDFLKANKTDITFLDSLSPYEYYRLMKHACCLIGNTSSGLREGAFLGTPYVCIGERQQNREHAGNVMYAEFDFVSIREAVCHMMGRHFPYDGRFGYGDAGAKIAKILAESEVVSCSF